MAGPRLIPIFISYSHRDKAWRDQIASTLERADLEVLDDTLLLPGQNWNEELRKLWERARAAILIVTPNFLASESIQSGELPQLLELQKKNGLRLIPVITEPSDWQTLDAIRDILVFPRTGKPLASE